MSGEPRLVTRERLLRTLAAFPVAAVEAGSGYGKSVLATQYSQMLGVATVRLNADPFDHTPEVLIASLRRALAEARLSDLVAATDLASPLAWIDRLLDGLSSYPEGVLLIIDDAHHLSETPTVDLLARLIRDLPNRHRLLIAARSFIGPLDRLWQLERVGRLETDTLAFTVEETGQLMTGLGVPVTDHQARMLVESTQGWATALTLAAAIQRRDPQSPYTARSAPIASSLRTINTALSPADRDTVLGIAHLPLLSATIVDTAAGPGTFERIVAAGLPIVRTATGWWEMPGPVSEHLAGQADPDQRIARIAADEYGRHGDQTLALRVLIEAKLDDEAAALLAGLAPYEVEQLGLALVRDLITNLPADVKAAHPRVFLHAARLAETAHLGDLRSGLLEQADGCLAPLDEPPLIRELRAEQARDLMWDARTRREARTVATEVLEAAAPQERVARARALEVLGRLGSWFSDEGPLPEAAHLLRESAEISRSIGERTWTAQALAALGAGVEFALCRFQRSMVVLDEALGELPARNRYRAMIQTFRADTLTELGRFTEAEAVIAEIRQIGNSFREDWILAYAEWNQALLASYQGDAARTAQAVATALRHPEGWFDQTSGVEFLAQAADYLDRVGEHQRAAECLDQARARMEGAEHLVRVHGAAVMARSGDPVAARETIARTLEEMTLEPQELWPLTLLMAHAALRAGDDDAGQLAAEACELCLELGHPEGPVIRERQLAAPLIVLAERAGSRAAAALGSAADSWSIQLLGGFAVARAGRPLTLPPGRPARALRTLALNGGRLHAEALGELLWPGTSRTVALNRLRNVLSRIRSVAGEVIVRDGEIVCLAADCEIDADSFQARADAALTIKRRSGNRSAAGPARAALELYRGELLPDERYDDEVAARRGQLASQYLALVDLLTEVSEQDGEVDEALRLAGRALAVEPEDERRYVRIARLLESQGRTGSAAAALEGALRSNTQWSAAARSEVEGALTALRHRAPRVS